MSGVERKERVKVAMKRMVEDVQDTRRTAIYI
jgi:hypothetical protein